MPTFPDAPSDWLASLAMLDTLRYRIHAHTTLPGQPQRLGVVAEILLPPSGTLGGTPVHVALRRVLSRLSSGVWTLFLERRKTGPAGYERLRYRASVALDGAHSATVGNTHLPALLRDISTESIRLYAPSISMEVDLVRYREMLHQLAQETRETVEAHVASLYARSGRDWRIQSLRALESAQETQDGTGQAPKTSLDVPDGIALRQGGGVSGIQEVLLVTEIELSAPPPTRH